MAAQSAEALQAYKALQQEMQTFIHTRTQLMQQITETELVKEELGRLDEDAVVYKLIGPAMIKQDLMEANTNVAKRLEYIQGEVKRITNKLADLEGRSKEQQQLILKLRAQEQQQPTAMPAA